MCSVVQETNLNYIKFYWIFIINRVRYGILNISWFGFWRSVLIWKLAHFDVIRKRMVYLGNPRLILQKLCWNFKSTINASALKPIIYRAKVEENVDFWRHRLWSFLQGVIEIFEKCTNTKLNLGQHQRWAFLEMRWLDSSMSRKHSR